MRYDFEIVSKDFRFLTPLRCVRNHYGLVRPHKRDENGLAPGTGNHKGCPYNRFAEAYFHSNDIGRGCAEVSLAGTRRELRAGTETVITRHVALGRYSPAYLRRLSDHVR